MNQRSRNERNIIRHRRRGTIPTLRWTLPTGTRVYVTPSPFRPGRAMYNTRNATVFGPWPATTATLKEVSRWS